MSTITIVIRKRGRLTLPADLLEKYGIKEDDTFTLIDLDGSFLLTPHSSQVNHLGSHIERILHKNHLTPDDILNSLDDDRQRYFREHFNEC